MLKRKRLIIGKWLQPGQKSAWSWYLARANGKKIEAMSNGRLKIKVYGAGEIVPAMEVFETVSQGTVQLGHGASYYWKGKSQLLSFTTVPFGLTAQEMNGWLLHGGGLELWREL